MGGRRLLCQSLNAELAPKGIHMAHVLIDGSVDAPDTLGKMLGPERFQELRETQGLENDGLILPEKGGRDLLAYRPAAPLDVDI